MTAPLHRAAAASPVSAGVTAGWAHDANMWWVAWRQHRLQVLVLLAIAAAGATGLAILRWRVVATFQELDCPLFPTDPNGQGCVDATGVSVWWNYGFSSWSAAAHLGMLLAPIVLGAFAAAPIFTREFGRSTHILALTQAVGRGRWLVAKTTVVLVPLLAVLLVLGVAMQWTDGAVGVTAYSALESNNFLTRGIMPAAVGLAAFALALAIGMIARSLLPALVAGILIGGVMLYGLAAVQLHVLPADRTVTAMAEQFPAVVTQSMIDKANAQAGQGEVVTPTDRNQAFVGNGYLNASGDTVDVPNKTLGECFDGGNKAGEAAAKAAGLSEGGGLGGSIVISGDRAGSNAVEAASGAFYNSPEYRTAYNESVQTCFDGAGVAAQYTDVLPGNMLWPLRWAMAGVCVILAALFFGVAAWRLKPAVAKR